MRQDILMHEDMRNNQSYAHKSLLTDRLLVVVFVVKKAQVQLVFAGLVLAVVTISL